MENNILSTLSEEQKQLIKVQTFRKNEVIFREGETCISISIVISGEIKISSISFEGDELVYNILTKNDIFGNNLIFSDEPLYKGDVIALGKTTVALISKDNVLEFMSINKDFLKEYLRITSDQAVIDKGLLKILDSSEIEDRLLTYIKLNGRQLKMKSIQDTANKIHVTREALSRTIKKLVEKEIISKEENTLKILK